MAAAAVRYLRADPANASRAKSVARPAVEALPRPELRCVGENERAPVDQTEFRRVLGNFATGVTVITAPAPAPQPPPADTPDVVPVPDSGPADTRPAGFACQSFSALSLDPPLVVFMVGRTSTTWPRIARAGVFCVNVLGADQGELCRRFAASGTDKFAGVHHTPAPTTGSPRLIGATAWIDCTVHAVHTGGDHLIVVGRVESLGTDDGTRAGDGTEAGTGARAAKSAPLLFHRGRFGGFTTT